MKFQADWRLYLVTDRELCGARGVAAVVRAAVAGGVTVVQLRDKCALEDELVRTARELVPLLKDSGVPLIINDSVEAVLRSGAAGVHLGQSDGSVLEARARLGDDALLGLSVENRGQAIAANTLPVDYLGLSPVFSTPTKTDTAPPLGLEGVAGIRAVTGLPLVGIGGINIANAVSVLQAGADGLAVVSAVCSAADPRIAAEELLTMINRTGPV